MRPKNAIGKTFLQRVVGLEPNPDHHRTNDSPAKELTAGRSVRKRARARLRSAQNVENPPLEVAPTQTTVGSTAPLCSALRRLVRAVNEKPKKAERDFHAIRRKGAVPGQSRQPLMSWRRRSAQCIDENSHPHISAQCVDENLHPRTVR